MWGAKFAELEAQPGATGLPAVNTVNTVNTPSFALNNQSLRPGANTAGMLGLHVTSQNPYKHYYID